MASSALYLSRAGTAVYSKGRIIRGATSIFEQAYVAGFSVPNATGTIENFALYSPIYLDSPNTTSSTTYKIQIANNSTGTITAQAFNSSTSSIVLVEIGA